MFTIDQIKEAHSKVKSGADFPNFIQDLISLGVKSYETFVSDGHTIYYGENKFTEKSKPKYSELLISNACNKEEFIKDLKLHQRGKTDYPTFCSDCAKSGIEKWIVDINKMTCTYFDKANNEILIESIPSKK
jgi:uncharacterized protein YbcV (DUF1398 family)